VVTGGEVEHPVGHREVDHGAPDHGEDHPSAELRAVGNGAGDQGHGNDREYGLEGDERHHRVGTGLVIERDLGGGSHKVLQTQILHGIAVQAITNVVSEVF